MKFASEAQEKFGHFFWINTAGEHSEWLCDGISAKTCGPLAGVGGEDESPNSPQVNAHAFYLSEKLNNVQKMSSTMCCDIMGAAWLEIIDVDEVPDSRDIFHGERKASFVQQFSIEGYILVSNSLIYISIYITYVCMHTHANVISLRYT